MWHFEGGVVGFVAAETDDRARRSAAFLYEAAFASFEEFRELRCRSHWELHPQRVEHLLPHQAIAIDHAIGRFQIENIALAEAGPAEPDAIETDDHRRIPIEHDERRHILNHAGTAADHGELADAAKLMDGRRTAQVGSRPHLDVAAEHRAVSQYDVVLDHAVVSYVRGDHEKAAAANPSDVPGFECPMDGRVFAEDVAVANFRRAGVFWHVNVLRHAADDRTFKEQIVASNDCARFYGDAGGQITAIAQDHSGFHNAEWPDPHISTELSVRTYDGKRMN